MDCALLPSPPSSSSICTPAGYRVDSPDWTFFRDIRLLDHAHHRQGIFKRPVLLRRILDSPGAAHHFGPFGDGALNPDCRVRRPLSLGLGSGGVARVVRSRILCQLLDVGSRRGLLGPSAEKTPLLHTWSLAIEEQYYLFYPLLLIPVLKFAGKHRLTVLGIGAILSLALCLFAALDHPSAALYLLPTRAWELGTGAILALLHVSGLASPFPRFAARLAAIVGLLLIVASYGLIHNENDFPGYKAIFAVLGAALILGGASAREFPGNLLAARPLVYIGKISYSLYLWHCPFLAYVSILNGRYDTDLTGFHLLPAIILLSILSYHFVETPARRSERWEVPVSVAFLVTLATAIA
jgi:peptidoglycan/LPS O-acetylase OafA/YrhL